MEFELNWEISQREDRRGSKTTPGNRPCRIVFASFLGHSGLIVSSFSCHMLASSTRFGGHGLGSPCYQRQAKRVTAEQFHTMDM